MTDEHKLNIKKRAMELLFESDDVVSNIPSRYRCPSGDLQPLNQIAECNEVIFAKIARAEYPATW